MFDQIEHKNQVKFFAAGKLLDAAGMKDVADGLCGRAGAFIQIHFVGLFDTIRSVSNQRQEPAGAPANIKHIEGISRNFPNKFFEQARVQTRFDSFEQRIGTHRRAVRIVVWRIDDAELVDRRRFQKYGPAFSTLLIVKGGGAGVVLDVACVSKQLDPRTAAYGANKKTSRHCEQPI